MIVVSSAYGITLVFKDEKDLKTVVNHLQGQLEWVQTEEVDPPYLYCTYDDRIPKRNIDTFLDWLKYTIGLGQESIPNGLDIQDEEKQSCPMGE